MLVCARSDAPVFARMYMYRGVYVCEAILSRFKRLSPLVWYQYTTYGSYALKRAVRCFSVAPLVGCGVLGVA